MDFKVEEKIFRTKPRKAEAAYALRLRKWGLERPLQNRLVM
jgi:hypothetical protein